MHGWIPNLLSGYMPYSFKSKRVFSIWCPYDPQYPEVIIISRSSLLQSIKLFGVVGSITKVQLPMSMQLHVYSLSQALVALLIMSVTEWAQAFIGSNPVWLNLSFSAELSVWWWLGLPNLFLCPCYDQCHGASMCQTQTNVTLKRIYSLV